jgi:hypothetical protein
MFTNLNKISYQYKNARAIPDLSGPIKLPAPRPYQHNNWFLPPILLLHVLICLSSVTKVLIKPNRDH